jgi:predicted PurR-regulated permease PerM
MDNRRKPPLYEKLSIIVMGLLSFFFILYIGKDILVPIIFSTIIAILLNPIVNFLCKKGINKVVAILIVLVGAIILIFALMYFIGSQATMFSDSMPQFKQKFSLIFNDIINWVSQTFNVSKPKIDAWMDKAKGEGMNNSSFMIGQTLGTISGVLILIFLLPVYIFMVLFYKPLLLEFIAQLFQRDKHPVVAEVLVETKTLIQSYLSVYY